MWVGKVGSQVRWEDETGRLAEWLAVEITVQGERRLGWVTTAELDAMVAVGVGRGLRSAARADRVR